jgi:hypothetical protein
VAVVTAVLSYFLWYIFASGAFPITAIFSDTYYAKVDHSSSGALSRGFFYVVRYAVWGVFP